MRVWLSVGSNEQRRRNILSAILVLQAEFGDLILSPVYESAAEGFAGNAFYNLVIGFDTNASLPDLAGMLRRIESEHGRVRGGKKFAPRTLDLDILTYGDLVYQSADLEIPRDEILKYGFVAGPLADVAPDSRHPVTRQTFAQIWAAFPEEKRKSLSRVELAGRAGSLLNGSATIDRDDLPGDVG